MKDIFSLLSVLLILPLTGCLTHHTDLDTPRTVPSADRTRFGLTQIVSYRCPEKGMEIQFFRSPGSPVWLVSVQQPGRDHLDLQQLPSRSWDESATKCNAGEGLRLVDQALCEFSKTHPTAKFDTVFLDMHLIVEIWKQSLTTLAAGMSKLDALKDVEGESRGGPPALREAVIEMLAKSQVVDEMVKLLRHHGLNVEQIGLATPVLFDDSLQGAKWAAIAELPGLGIAAPGVIEFQLAVKTR